jgi:uncharacterized protein YfaS (alpha-2-macroglobulin family)
VLPLVLFSDYIDALGMRSEVRDPEAACEAEMLKWAEYQKPDGGFPYWPWGGRADRYVSLRIAQIDALARRKHWKTALNADALFAYIDKQYDALESARQTAKPGEVKRLNYLEAYALYVAALAGRPIDAARCRALLAAGKDDAAVLSFVGMALRMAGQTEAAASAGQTLKNLMQMDTRAVTIAGDDAASPAWMYFDTQTERLALALHFFAGAPDESPADDMLRTRLLYTLLGEERAGGYWENTACTARVLGALAALIERDKPQNAAPASEVSLGGRDLFSASFNGISSPPVSKVFRFKDFPLAALRRDTPLELMITQRNTGTVYWTASLGYALPAEMQGARAEGLSVSETITDVETGAPVTGVLMAGRLYRAAVRVTTGRARTYLALRVPLPSGAEILDATFKTSPTATMDNETAGNDEDNADGNDASGQEIMDNEVRYFFDRFRPGQVVVQFLFRAVRRGVFPTPPARAECMYEPEVFGRAPGALWQIK